MEGKSWSDVLDFTQQCVNEKLKILHEIWAEFGYDDQLINERHESVKAHIEKILDEMVSEEEESRKKYLKLIENMYVELHIISKTLDLKTDSWRTGLEDLSFIQVEKLLREKLKEVQDLKAIRLEKFESLRTRERTICSKLGIPEGEMHLDNVISDSQLKEFEEYIASKEAERDALKMSFIDIKSNILKLMKELEKRPFLDFEKQVCCGNDDDFVLSRTNMDKLRALYQSLETELEENKVTSIELRERLSLLWERLHESYEVRQAFLSSFPGYTERTLDALKCEIQRCEEKKRENIKPFVHQIREELEDWWTKCFFGEIQKSQFLPFYSDCYNEDLLELHEEEIKKVKKYFEVNVDIIQLIQERQILWQKLVELEEKSRNKDRFKNRGGDLLKEEKERKMIQKKLPKIENELLRHVSSFEARTGQAFLYFGENITDFIANQWDSLKENRERGKLARKKDQNVTAKSTTKSVSKRKLSQSAASSKVRRMLPMELTSDISSKPSTSTVSAGKSTLKVPGSTEISNITGLTSYSDFKEDFEKLNKEINCRSSVVPSGYPKSVKSASQKSVVGSNSANPRIPTQHMTTPNKPPRRFGTPVQTPQVFATPRTTPRKKYIGPNTQGPKTCPRLGIRQRPLIL